MAESDGVLLTRPRPRRARPPPPRPASVPSGATASADLLTERLRDLVERVLKLNEHIDPARPLADYGFDSLSGMKIVAAVDEEFGVAVPLGDFFEQPTLRELTAHLSANWLAGAATGPPPCPKRPAHRPCAHRSGPGHRPRRPARRLPGHRGRGRVLRPHRTPRRPATPVRGPARPLGDRTDRARHLRLQPALALWLDRDLDVLALRAVLQDLVDRHAELRATVHAGDEEPYARIATEPELPSSRSS
ncbi:phosphopantetheine-binding protein [Streptomyces thinghirensis]|nr:phosphopantetheine-binding protein [Streptomyces thinghirensis]